jgi:DNA polymerase III subunit epsilon
MRQIVLDTETTGLDASLGHRIIEIAAVEVVNRRFTDRHFHCYLNPDREIDAGAMQVHGISNEFLADKPRFRDLVGDFLEFVSGAELIIHNAPFDVGFLDAELALVGRDRISEYCPLITDTLKMAKSLHPGKRNSLDALCERYAVDNSARTLHGALLDARLLAEVYLALTRGQDSLLMDALETSGPSATELAADEKLEVVVVRASEEELSLHAAQLEEIDRACKGACLWKKLEAPGV